LINLRSSGGPSQGATPDFDFDFDVPNLDLVVASLRDRLVEGTPLYPLLY